MELVNVVCGDSSVLCCENSQNESTQFETTSEDPRASEETKEESIGKRTLRAAVKTVQLVRQESKKVVNYIDQEAGELVEAASLFNTERTRRRRIEGKNQLAKESAPASASVPVLRVTQQ